MDDAWAILAVAILPTFLSAMAGVESYHMIQISMVSYPSAAALTYQLSKTNQDLSQLAHYSLQ